MSEYNVFTFTFFLALPFSSNISFSIPAIGQSSEDPFTSFLGERSWFKPGKRLLYPEQVDLFLLRLHPEWLFTPDESLEARLEKKKKMEHERSLLYTYARIAILNLRKELDLDPRYDSKLTWGKVGPVLKKKYLDLVERICVAGSIPINRCVGSWMAIALMSIAAQHRMGDKEVFYFNFYNCQCRLTLLFIEGEIQAAQRT